MQISRKTYLPTLIGILGLLAGLAFIFAAPAHASANENAPMKLFGDAAFVLPHEGRTVIAVSSGNAAVSGAKVTSVSGSVITAETKIGNTGLTWSVLTDANTHFLPISGSHTLLADIKAGDSIAFFGTIDTGASGLVVHATFVRDGTFVTSKPQTSFSGTVASVNTSAKTFVLNTKENSSITVQLASSTQVFSGADTFLFSNLTVGDSVKVKGTYDAQAKILYADRITVDREAAHPASSSNVKFRTFLDAFRNRFGLFFGFR